MKTKFFSISTIFSTQYVAIIIGLCMFSSSYPQHQITGSVEAYYLGTPIESCFVEMIGLSPGTVNGSQLTGVQGTYQFSDVPSGLYRLRALHSCYLTDSVDCVIAEDQDLSFQLLKTANVYETQLPDTLVKKDSPYFIKGVSLNVSAHLVVEPGVHIVFVSRYATLNLDGGITAIGTPDDTITFTSSYKDSSFDRLADSGVWIRMPSPNLLHEFRYCRFGFLKGIDIEQDVNVNFESCHFTNMHSFITCAYKAGAVHFKNNRAINCYHGFSFATPSTAFDSIVIVDNLINANTPLHLRYHSSNGSLGRLYIRRNTFIGLTKIENNTLVREDTIASNIFTDIRFSNVVDKSTYFAYNDVVSCNTEMPLGIGTKQTTNINGDSCDFFFNIFEDAIITNTETGEIGKLSPCIDAGQNHENIGVYQGRGSFIKTWNNEAFVPHGAIKVLGNHPNLVFRVNAEQRSQFEILVSTVAGRVLWHYSSKRNAYSCPDIPWRMPGKFNSANGIYIVSLVQNSKSVARRFLSIR